MAPSAGFLGTLPVGVNAPVLTASDSSAKMTVGAWATYRDASGNISVLQYVKADNATVSQHYAVKQASNTVGGVVKCAAADAPGTKPMGIAAGTIASNQYGWIYTAGYCPGADFTTTVSTNEYLSLSATAGELVVLTHNATLGNSTTPYLYAKARDSASDAAGSIYILYWG